MIYVGNKIIIYFAEKCFFHYVWVRQSDRKLLRDKHQLEQDLQECYSKLIHENVNDDGFVVVDI